MAVNKKSLVTPSAPAKTTKTKSEKAPAAAPTASNLKTTLRPQFLKPTRAGHTPANQ